MAHFDTVLQPPSYGWKDAEGALVRPTTAQILREFASRLNVFRSRKQWLPLSSWLAPLLLAPFLVGFFVWYFSWPLLAAGFVYSMVVMGSHGTVWYHRYGTHKAFTFTHPIWRVLTRNLVVKVVPEEIYVVSHFVHHQKSDQPGDPYNPQGGFLYCFLADAVHQPIAHDLSEEAYAQTCKMLEHTGMPMNSYAQYQVWGTVAHPVSLWGHRLLNWAFWFTAFTLVGGLPLACALLGGACVWAIGIRTFNYGAHGSGEDRRREGEDFSHRDRSINEWWPGLVAGEWHSNHHLYPNSARSGFKPWQIDIPYAYVRLLHALGGVNHYIDRRDHFYDHHYGPWLEAQDAKRRS